MEKTSYVKVWDLNSLMEKRSILRTFAYMYFWIEYNAGILKTIYLPSRNQIRHKN